MGIGRNQYIDLMNQSRSTKKFGGFLRQLKSGVGVGGGGRDLLPPRVVETVPILPWWVVQVGYVTEEDMKVRGILSAKNVGSFAAVAVPSRITSWKKEGLSPIDCSYLPCGCKQCFCLHLQPLFFLSFQSVDKAEHSLIDQLIDGGGFAAGHADHSVVLELYRKGLVYFDVPIEEADYVIVPPLEGFVMNRVLGDYFETLLYKIFVSIDENTTVAEVRAGESSGSAVRRPFSTSCLFVSLLMGLCQGPQPIHEIAGYEVLLQSLLPGSLHSLDTQSRFDASL